MIENLGVGANGYQKAVLRTAPLKDFSNENLVINGLLGLCGESGECADYLKKHIFQGHDLDKLKLAEELGDVAWYIALTAHALGFNLSDILEMNIEKLKKRYPDGFDAERSINREEK
jgi:NTP pyrophosphatase (non-canonical NTP hydrolase)